MLPERIGDIGVIDSVVIVAIVGVLSATVGALIWIIKYLFTEFKPALDGLVKATEQNTVATKSADVYLRERNGRDNEFHAEVMKSLENIPIEASKQATIVARELKRVGDITAAQLKEVGTQQVVEQIVEHQHVSAATQGVQAT